MAWAEEEPLHLNNNKFYRLILKHNQMKRCQNKNKINRVLMQVQALNRNLARLERHHREHQEEQVPPAK